MINCLCNENISKWTKKLIWTTHEVDEFTGLAAACVSSANNAAWGSNGGVKGLAVGGLNVDCAFVRGSIVGTGVGPGTDTKNKPGNNSVVILTFGN